MTALLLGSRALWYFGRGSGLVLMVLLTAIVVLGIFVRMGVTPGGTQRFVVLGLHKNLALFSILLGLAHVVTLELDPFVSVGWLGAVIPFSSPYRPLWVAFGAMALDAFAAVILTSLMRYRLGLRYWKGIHFLAYLAWPFSLLHSLGTGTDARLSWAFALQIACLIAVVLSLAVRVARSTHVDLQRRLAAASATVVAPLALIFWAVTGPYQPGWARRAGTPASLLGGHAISSTSGSYSSGIPFSGSFVGTLSQSDSRSRTTVVVQGTVGNGLNGSLKVVLIGTPSTGGGVSLLSGQGTYLSRAGATWTGPVETLHGGDITMLMKPTSPSLAAPSAVLGVSMQVSTIGTSVSGTARGSLQSPSNDSRISSGGEGTGGDDAGSGTESH